jgi:hypothetical protein
MLQQRCTSQFAAEMFIPDKARLPRQKIAPLKCALQHLVVALGS